LGCERPLGKRSSRQFREKEVGILHHGEGRKSVSEMVQLQGGTLLVEKGASTVEKTIQTTLLEDAEKSFAYSTQRKNKRRKPSTRRVQKKKEGSYVLKTLT